MMAARITQMQAFFGLMQMAMMPMMFLLGALYPLNGLPTWLSVLTRFNALWRGIPAVHGREELFPCPEPGRQSGRSRRPLHARSPDAKT